MRKDLSFFVNISITRFSGPINHAFHKNWIYTFFCNGDLQQKYCEGKQKPLFPCGKRGKCYSHFTLPVELVQLSEVLDGADHLRGVGVLVVVPGHDLHLIGVEATKPVFSTVSRLLP